jgi:streptogramin lyase
MNPYEAAVDSKHHVWVTFQNSDEMGRFDPETGKWTIYSWPTKGMAQRQNHMLEREGVLQFVSASGQSHRVGRNPNREGPLERVPEYAAVFRRMGRRSTRESIRAWDTR